MHVDATSSTASNQTIQRKMCDAIVEFVSVINTEDMLLVYLLNALHYNKIRAQVCFQSQYYGTINILCIHVGSLGSKEEILAFLELALPFYVLPLYYESQLIPPDVIS